MTMPGYLSPGYHKWLSLLFPPDLVINVNMTVVELNSKHIYTCLASPVLVLGLVVYR